MLAGGSSRRAGTLNKLLARDRDGCRMIVRTVTSVLRSRADDVIVVLGHDAAAVSAALDAAGLESHGGRLKRVCADDHAEGLAASLRRGMSRAVSCHADSVLVCLGDMPLVLPATLDRLIAEAATDTQTLAWIPTSNGKRGNPVLWRRPLFEALLALSGDRGGRLLLQRHQARVAELAVDDPGILEDFDTPDRLSRYTGL